MIIETKTKSGVPVEIRVTENNRAKATAQHPKLGEIAGFGDWGTLEGRSGFVMQVKLKGKRTQVCMEIPTDDYEPIRQGMEKRKADEKKAVAEKDKADRKKALAECPGDHVITRCLWTNGDLMSGEYQTEDGTKVIGPDMLKCHYGWYFLPLSLVEEKKDKNKKIADKRANAKAKVEAAEKDIFEMAARTGEKNVLQTFPINCTDPREECNTDIVTVWAMPNGTKTETCHHTW